MAVTNKQILGTLEAMPDAIAQAIAAALANQPAAPPVSPASNGTQETATSPNTVILDESTLVLDKPNGGQPNVRVFGFAKTSKAYEIGTAINKMTPGQAIEYRYSVTSRRGTNQLFVRGSYDSKANPFDDKTRSCIKTRHTSQSGKTVADGRSFKMTLPPRAAITSDDPTVRDNARIRVEMLS